MSCIQQVNIYRLTVYKALLLFSVLFFLSESSYSLQSSDPDTTDLKVGVVLSGGGAKGVAHIGVLRVLEEAGIEVDFISGTSMGSIIGGFYAVGKTSDEMEQLTREADWSHLFSDSPGRRHLSMFEKKLEQRFIVSFPVTQRDINLPRGLIPGQNISMWLNRQLWPYLDVTDFDSLSIPFATVATDLETGEAVVFRSGYLPDAIRASIAFPTILTPFEVDGRLLVDGGLIRNLPVEEVLNMGADYVIAVDASGPLHTAEELNSIASILNQAIGFRINEEVEKQKELADLVITIPELYEYRVIDFEGSERFIEVGERHARHHMKTLQEIGKRQGNGNPAGRTEEVAGRTATERESIRLDNISVEGNRYVPDFFILNEFELQTGQQVNAREIERAVNLLYSSKLFELITYQIEQTNPAGREPSYHLRLKVIENTSDAFNVGVRFETETQASVNLQSEFRNLALGGTNLRLGLRLGRELEFVSDYLLFAGLGSNLALNTRLGYFNEPVEHYQGGERI